MADNVKYLNYGDLLVELLALFNQLANEVQGYLKNLPWSTNRKKRFMSAYSDIMNRGILGASNNTGLWVIDVGGDVLDINNLKDKDKQAYLEAAYFIQLQMAGLPTKSSLEKKEEIELPKYDNFSKNFVDYISQNYYGGNPIRTQEDWNILDERNAETGLRGTDKRVKRLSEYLLKYSESLEEGKYDFKESPFKDLTDLKTRINTAITKLNDGTWNLDDTDALNAIGLRSSDWFNNGSGDTTTVILPDGTQLEITYGQLAEYNLKIKELQLKEKQSEQNTINETNKLNKTNYWDGFKTYSFNNLNGRPLTQEESNINYLSNLFAKDKWSGDEASQIVLAFKLAEKNGKLVPLSNEELNKLNPSTWKNRSKYLRKIDGINSNLYYDTLSKQYKKFYKNEQTSFLDILNLNSPEALKEKQNKQTAVNMNTPISQMTEWSPEMKKEIEAIAWDAASILNPEAFTGSAMALNAARLRGEANPNRSILESTLDYGTGLLGGILGFGDLLVTGKLGYRLYQLGKSIGSVSKFAGIMGAGFGAIGAYEARDSIAKLANPDSLTPQDLENISYGLMGLIGLKSFAKARNKQIIGKQANPTVTEYNITVKDKNNKTHEIKVDETTAKEILLVRTLGKKKETVDSEILNMPKIKESIQKYKEANPTKKLEIEGASIVNDSKSAFGISGRNKLITSNQVKNPNAPEYIPVGTKRYNPFGYMALGNNKWGYYLGGGWQRKAWENAAPEHSSKGLQLRAKEFWSPEPKSIKTPESTVETPKTETTSNPSKTSSINTKSYNKNSKYEYNILNTESKVGKILQKGSELKGVVLADGNKYDFNYSKDGTASVILNGKPVFSLKNANQSQAKEAFSSFIKDINSKISKLSLNLYLKRFELNYLDGLRELKRKGFFLKQGGIIDKQRIQQYKKYIKK